MNDAAAVDRDGARLGRYDAEQRFAQFVDARPDQAENAQYAPPPGGEADLVEFPRHAQIAYSHYLGAVCGSPGRIDGRKLLPEHEFGDAGVVHALVVRGAGGDVAPVAKDGESVGELEHLVESVGDVDDRNAPLAQHADMLEQDVDLAAGEDGGGLVEHENGHVFLRQGAQDGDALPLDGAEFAHGPGQVDLDGEPLEQRLGAGAQGRAGNPREDALLLTLGPEKDVLVAREGGDHLRVLVDRRHPAVDSRLGRGDIDRAAVDGNPPGVHAVDAREDLDQCALTRPVNAQQGVDLAAGEAELHAVQRSQTGEVLDDSLHVQGRRLHCGSHRLGADGTTGPAPSRTYGHCPGCRNPRLACPRAGRRGPSCPRRRPGRLSAGAPGCP